MIQISGYQMIIGIIFYWNIYDRYLQICRQNFGIEGCRSEKYISYIFTYPILTADALPKSRSGLLCKMWKIFDTSAARPYIPPRLKRTGLFSQPTCRTSKDSKLSFLTHVSLWMNQTCVYFFAFYHKLDLLFCPYRF